MILNAILIFILQIIYVPLLTLRTTLVVKGERTKAALISLLEAIVYIISLGIVFSDLKNIANIIAYVIGYGLGIYIGGIIEEKLAIGYKRVDISLINQNLELVQCIRDRKFGVTSFTGRGINNEERHRLEIISPRAREKGLIELVIKYEPTAFIVSYDLTQFKGGYIKKQLKK
ncbi:MAG: DUF5698 domain-containing protein [Clostridium sp.]